MTQSAPLETEWVRLSTDLVRRRLPSIMDVDSDSDSDSSASHLDPMPPIPTNDPDPIEKIHHNAQVRQLRMVCWAFASYFIALGVSGLIAYLLE